MTAAEQQKTPIIWQIVMMKEQRLQYEETFPCIFIWIIKLNHYPHAFNRKG